MITIAKIRKVTGLPDDRIIEIAKELNVEVKNGRISLLGRKTILDWTEKNEMQSRNYDKSDYHTFRSLANELEVGEGLLRRTVSKKNLKKHVMRNKVYFCAECIKEIKYHLGIDRDDLVKVMDINMHRGKIDYRLRSRDIEVLKFRRLAFIRKTDLHKLFDDGEYVKGKTEVVVKPEPVDNHDEDLRFQLRSALFNVPQRVIFPSFFVDAGFDLVEKEMDNLSSGFKKVVRRYTTGSEELVGYKLCHHGFEEISNLREKLN